jgi:hypothetical protein
MQGARKFAMHAAQRGNRDELKAGPQAGGRLPAGKNS